MFAGIVTVKTDVALPPDGMVIRPLGFGGSTKENVTPETGIDETSAVKFTFPEYPLSDVPVIVVGVDFAEPEPFMVANMLAGFAERE